MKKNSGSKSDSISTQVSLDMQSMLTGIERRLFGLETKIDALIAQTSVSSKPTVVKEATGPRQHSETPHRQIGPTQQHAHFHRHSDDRKNTQRERVLHKAICADCGSACEVPFKPTGERPVYCKVCFSKRRTGGAVKTNPRQDTALATTTHEDSVNSAAPENQIPTPTPMVRKKSKNLKPSKKTKSQLTTRQRASHK